MASPRDRSLAFRAVRVALCLAFASLLLLVPIVVYFWPAMLFPDERVLLTWTDPKTRTKVSLVDPYSLDLVLKLRVKRSGQQRDRNVIDKSSYGTLRFALYHDRLLALNGEFIFAAYDLRSDQIVGYYELPFTVYEGQGTVLASFRRGETAQMRDGFPMKRESDAK